MFTKAIKSKSKLRCAVSGPSGSGKTYSSLAIASGLGDKIALIDTERGSACKYADKFNFDVCELKENTISEYIKIIESAQQAGYDVLIIDSISHAWESLLEHIEKLSQTKYRGNSWSAWSEGTPEQKKFINSILMFDGHVICTMRSKTEWVLEQSERNGRTVSVPKKVGMAPEQRKNIEYEFDFAIEITEEHVARITKDRTGKFQDKIIEKPGKKLGEELKEWLNEGEEVVNKNTETKSDLPTDIITIMDDFREALSKGKTYDELVATFKSAKEWAIELKDEKISSQFITEITEFCKQSPLSANNKR
jgi:hypothetical protein